MLAIEANASSHLMFEQVINKNFQILRNILPRINSLYQLNQELERSVSNIELKLTKLEQDNQNLHYEMRTDHLALESKISRIANGYNTIINEACILKKQSQVLAKSVKDIKTIHYQHKNDLLKEEKKEERSRRIIFKDETHHRILRNSIELQSDQIQQNSKVQFNVKSNISIDCQQKHVGENSKKSFSSAHEINSRKSNLKSNNKIKNPSAPRLIKKEKEKSSNVLDDISFHLKNKMIKKQCEEMMDKQRKENKEYFRLLDEKMNKLTHRIQQIDPHHNISSIIEKMKNLQFIQNLQYIEQSLLTKVDLTVFNNMIKDLGTRFTDLHVIVNKYANKQQTKRAIQYLQNKINYIFEEQGCNKKQSIHVLEISKKGCLRPSTGRRSQHKSSNNVEYSASQRKYKHNPPATSMHTQIMNGSLGQNRFSCEKKIISTQKQIKGQQSMSKDNPSSSVLRLREINMLRQRGIELLQSNKKKIKPKLKRERLIFQYD